MLRTVLSRSQIIEISVRGMRFLLFIRGYDLWPTSLLIGAVLRTDGTV